MKRDERWSITACGIHRNEEKKKKSIGEAQTGEPKQV